MLHRRIKRLSVKVPLRGRHGKRQRDGETTELDKDKKEERMRGSCKCQMVS